MSKDFVSREKLDEVITELVCLMENYHDQYLSRGYSEDDGKADAYQDAINILLEVMNDD